MKFIGLALLSLSLFSCKTTANQKTAGNAAPLGQDLQEVKVLENQIQHVDQEVRDLEKEVEQVAQAEGITQGSEVAEHEDEYAERIRKYEEDIVRYKNSNIELVGKLEATKKEKEALQGKMEIQLASTMENVISKDLWTNFRYKYRKNSILFSRDSLEQLAKKGDHVALILLLPLVENKDWMDKKLFSEISGESVPTSGVAERKFGSGFFQQIYPIEIGPKDKGNFLAFQAKMEKWIFSILQKAKNDGVQKILLPPINVKEAEGDLSEREIAYIYAIRALLTFIASTDGTYPQIILKDWTPIRQAVKKFIAEVYVPYFDGAEEGLSNISCWEKGEEAEIKTPLLYFENAGELHYNEFSKEKTTTVLFSEKQARRFIYRPSKKLLVNSQGKPMHGYGKFVIKRNGCLYWHNLADEYIAHVAFAAGNPIVSGGWIVAEKGKVLCVTSTTGHYRATRAHLDTTSAYLNMRGVQDFVKIERGCFAVANERGIPYHPQGRDR